MIRATITRHHADITPLDRDPRHPICLPAGWSYQVYDTTTRCNLIRGIENTHPAALTRACRLIRSLGLSDHRTS